MSQGAPPGQKRMSVHNRLLLNRAAVSGLRDVQIMLAVKDGSLPAATARVQQMGGRILYSAPAVGYLRVEVPIEQAVAVIADAGIDAYQISSLSKAAWYRDGVSEINATMFRGFERLPVVGAGEAEPQRGLPPPTIERSREPGYTADDDVGLGEWMREHPTFDGRGVTIAVIETGQVEFSHPTLGTAKTLDGTDVPKLAGILNTVGADDPDDTRVALDTDLRAITTWCSVGDRTYIMPRPGAYRFGLFLLPAGEHLVHRFAVIQDQTTAEVWVDTDGDTDFQDETPIRDVNERLDVRTLKLTHPREVNLGFVIAKGPAAGRVHIYVARSDHTTMLASVAAGAKADDSLAYGVAPGARVLLVRNYASPGLHTWIEGYLETVARPDVDVLTEAGGVRLAPDTAADFVGLLFRRMVRAYSKPIFHAASNSQLRLASVSALGDVFSIGGSLGPRTFQAVYGGAAIDGLMVHPMGAAGPSFDGMIKPDFLAPMQRIAAATWGRGGARLPANAPELQLPAGYWISCCTSASSPYAAGVAAVLLSGVRQQGMAYSFERLSRALRLGSRFLPGFSAHHQGNGVLDVNAAWRELHNTVEIPRIHTTANIVHPLAQYAARGPEGSGIFEHDGWSAGMTGRRQIRFRRESGPDSAVRYRVSWTGNDGTFAAPAAITLPLHATVPLPITIAPREAGAHSALLNLHDEATNAVVFRTQATIAAAEVFDPRTLTVRLGGSLNFMRGRANFVRLSQEARALTVDLEVVRGSVSVAITPGDSLERSFYLHVYPQYSRTFTKGRYTVVLPNPAAGTWRLDVHNVSAIRETDRTLVTTGSAEYTMTLRLLSAAVHARPADTGALTVDVENLAGELREPAIDVSPATFRSHSGRSAETGVPEMFDIDVPAGAATLAVQLRREGATGTGLELHLYDCTSGECFSHDFTLPAAAKQSMVVRRPKPGRWVAAVNAAPFPSADAAFVLEEIIAMPGQRHEPSDRAARVRGARWTQTVSIPAALPTAASGSTPVLLCELIDLAVQRHEEENIWETREYRPRLRQTPAAVGILVYRP